jgi:hypothetical protein
MLYINKQLVLDVYHLRGMRAGGYQLMKWLFFALKYLVSKRKK